jgi:hypothetical protein
MVEYAPISINCLSIRLDSVDVTRFDLCASSRAYVPVEANELVFPLGNGGVVIRLAINSFALLNAIMVVWTEISVFAFLIKVGFEPVNKALLDPVPGPLTQVIDDLLTIGFHIEKKRSIKAIRLPRIAVDVREHHAIPFEPVEGEHIEVKTVA